MGVLQTVGFAWRTLQLNRVPRMAPAEVARLQERRLRRLLRWAVARSPFYRAHYRSLDPERCTLAELPPTTKTELMAHFDRVVTDPRIDSEAVAAFLENPANLGQLFLGRYALSHTSGSQGQPMFLVQEPQQLELLFGLQLTRGNAAAVTPLEGLRYWLRPARLAVVNMTPGFFPSASAFSYMPASTRAFVRVLRLDWDDPHLIERLNAYRPRVLIAYACVLEMLAVRAAELRLAPHLQQVVNNSEVLTERARDRIMKAFGVPVLDNYATGECPFLSTGCPTDPGAHVNADWAILEVVDEAYRPVPPGSLGHKVLVTNLANRVQPILRYEVGDMLVMADQPCHCGSRLPRIGRIEGRAAEIFWVWDGSSYRQLLATAFKNACDYLRGVREWQVIQEERNRFRVRVEPLPRAVLEPRQAQLMLQQRLRQFGVPPFVEVTLEVVPVLLPDADTGKFRRIVRLVGPPDQADAAERGESWNPLLLQHRLTPSSGTR